MCSNCIFNSFHTLKCCCCYAIWGGIPHTEIDQHKLDCHLPYIHSWLRIPWHLERLSIVYLSLLSTFFSWHWGHCLPSLWSCHRIVTTTHSQTSNEATSDSELQSSDSKGPDDSEDDAQSDPSEMCDFIEHSYEVLFVPDTDVECVTVHSK